MRITAIPLVLVGVACISTFVAAAPAQSPQPQVEVTGATLVEFDDATGVWNLRGQPVVVTRGAVVVRAELVRYDTKQQLVTASSGVFYRDNVVEVSAGTVAVWVLTQTATAEGDVRVAYHGREPVELTAARVELAGPAGQATASGGAVLTHPRGTLSAQQIAYDGATAHAVADGGVTAETPDGSLRADRVEAFLETRELQADGNVSITRSDLEGRAARAALHQQTGVAELAGSATLRLGPHVFSAPLIAVELRTRRVTASDGVHLIAYPQP
jgi:lipopolysaccharide assembly outer membrane protein LptD (OstA)